MRAAFRHNGSLRSPFTDDIPTYVLLVEVGTSLPEGIVADLDAALADALAPAFSGAAPLIDDVLVGRAEDFWAIRHSISDGVARSGLVIAFDIGVKRSDLPTFRAAATRMIARDFPMLDVYDFGHCGDGGDHFNLVWSDPERTPEVERRPVIDAVRDFGGTFSAEHGVGPSNQEFYDRYTPEAQRMLSSLLKEGLDAHGLIGNIRL